MPGASHKPSFLKGVRAKGFRCDTLRSLFGQALLSNNFRSLIIRVLSVHQDDPQVIETKLIKIGQFFIVNRRLHLLHPNSFFNLP